MLCHHLKRVSTQDKVVQRAGCCIGPAAQKRGAKATIHLQNRPRLRLFADFHVRCNFTAIAAFEHPLNQQFQLSTAGFLPIQPGFDDLRVVKHQQIAGLEQACQIGELPVTRGL